MEEDLAVPSIHLNGTSRSELVMQIYNAVRALENAGNMLQKAAPHSRDYYVQNIGNFSKAQQQHLSRMLRLGSIQTELMEIWEKLT